MQRTPFPKEGAAETANRVEIWRPRDFQAIELHRGQAVTQDYPRHWHDEIYLCATLEGTSYLESRGTTLSAPPGSLLVVPAGEVHANRKVDCSFRCIFQEQQALQNSFERYTEQAAPMLDFRSALVVGGETTASFLRLHRKLDGQHSELDQDEAVFAFVRRLVVNEGSSKISIRCQGSEGPAVERTKRFLEEHFAQPVRLSDLARLTGISPFRLNRSFCRRIGMPPHAYQLQVRIVRAKQLLRGGTSAAEAASATGFFDQSHFTHSFKRSEGMTPLQYISCCKKLQDGKTHTRYFEAYR